MAVADAPINNLEWFIKQHSQSRELCITGTSTEPLPEVVESSKKGKPPLRNPFHIIDINTHPRSRCAHQQPGNTFSKYLLRFRISGSRCFTVIRPNNIRIPKTGW
jgi:hypothetical protein